MTLKEAMKSIKPASQALRRQAKRRWDQVAKPLGSLGVLEEDIIRIAAASGSQPAPQGYCGHVRG